MSVCTYVCMYCTYVCGHVYSSFSAINGAKETEGFRTTFNLSSAAGCGGSNVSNATSDSTDKLDEDALIVSYSMLHSRGDADSAGISACCRVKGHTLR